MSLTNPNHAVTAQRLKEFHQGILPYLNGPKSDPVVYGMRILRDESVPSEKVVYLEDTVGMTPAYMDFTNNVFNYGSWENAFFMPKPCMLKYDGTVDYYLDPNDYTKKEDGTASDVANTSYDGNAMMEWPKIWLKIVPDATKDNKEADIFVSNTKVDNDYTDWNYHNSLGNSVEHFYTPIYNGSLIDGKLRSISGQQVSASKTASQELSYAQANNPTGSLIWTTEIIVDIDLINFLLILMGKSTDTQTIFGKGISNGTSAVMGSFRTGEKNTNGLFWGSNYGTNNDAVKVFGMENWWGFAFRRYLGDVYVNGTRKRKLTYGTEDGSSTTGYNFTGNGYLECANSTLSGTNNGFISTMLFGDKGMYPAVVSGSATTHYCDKLWWGSGTMVPVRSGTMDSDTGSGAFYCNLAYTESGAYWHTSAAISARPLS